MAFRQTLEVLDFLDSPRTDGAAVREYLLARGAYPEEVRVTRVGLVSDADGAVAALAAAAKLLEMRRAGDCLEGDVIVATHVCPDAPTEPHDPVPFMGSPVDMATMNGHEVSPEMDGILSIDATPGSSA